MREVITRIWCDEHLKPEDPENSQQVEAEEIQLGNEGKWFALDLCPGCRAQNIQPLVEFLADFGVRESSGNLPVQVVPQAKVSPRPATPDPQLFDLPDAQEAPGEQACAIPGCKMSAGRANLSKHYQRHHSLSRGPFGRYCPVCDIQLGMGTNHFITEHRDQEPLWRETLNNPDAPGHQRATAFLERQR